MNKPKILIVDDDESIRSQMRWALAEEYHVFEAGDLSSALNLVRQEHPYVVLLDLGLPPRPRDTAEGFQILKEILHFDPIIKVIIVSGNIERGNALKAIDMGAFDFFTKPSVMDEVRVVIKRALRMADLEIENISLRSKGKSDGLEEIVGNSPPMEAVFNSIRKVATVDVPVLILGESGTGKELTARAIHRLSYRKNGPFVVINCGAIPENLLESELFGHEKGAFTGATVQRKGKIEYAEKGTLFLDEIGELSLSLQIKLLRFLQDHIIERIGGRENISVDVRIIAATNKDLGKSAAEGKFRDDLFYRLSVVNITLPALRERGSDLYLLAKTFLHVYGAEYKKRLRGFQADALRSIEGYSWPGNVRELENRIKRGVVMAEGEWLTATDLGFTSPAEEQRLPKRLQEAREAVERQMILHALEKHGGVIFKAAEELGITRQTLTFIIKKLGIPVK